MNYLTVGTDGNSRLKSASRRLSPVRLKISHNQFVTVKPYKEEKSPKHLHKHSRSCYTLVMNKLKDLFYDTSDIFTAMLVIACAVIVIVTRVDAIITYPEKMLSGQPAQSGHIRPDIPEPAANDDDETYEPNEGAGEETGGADEPADGNEDAAAGSEGTSHSLYIAYGESMDLVADDLVKLGLFASRQTFTAALERNNAGSKVQAGTFIISDNATEDQVVNIITGRSNGQ